MEQYYNEHNNKINKKNIATDQASEDAIEILKEDPEETINKIKRFAEEIFKIDNSKENNKYDTLCTITKINNINTLIYLGDGEFDLETFNQKDINNNSRYKIKKEPKRNYALLRGFSKNTIPLFVIPKVNKENKRISGRRETKEYLNEYCTIVVSKRKQAINIDNKEINFNDINIQTLNKLEKSVYNILIKSNNNFKKIIEELKEIKDLNKFISTIKDKSKRLKEDKLANIETLKKLFPIKNINKDSNEREKIDAENESYKKMYNRIQSYNIKKEKFE